MDYLKEIRERQERFLQSPRESIENLISREKKFVRELVKLGIDQNRLGMVLIFKEFHKQYADLLGNLLKERLISARSFKDDLRDVSVLQTIAEMKRAVSNHKAKSAPLDEIMFSLKKSYAALLEILWGKLKRIIFLAGLNFKEKHLNLNKMKENLEELEKKYSVNLSLIKDILDGELRNCVNHERTYFENPNYLVFTEEENGKWKEIYRVNDNYLIEEILKIFTILAAFQHIETTVIISQIEPLLKLDDKQLAEYCKTGILTKEMQERIVN